MSYICVLIPKTAKKSQFTYYIVNLWLKIDSPQQLLKY